MLTIKSLRNVAIGIAAILLAAWVLQLLGSLIYSLSPAIYSYVVSAWNSAYAEHIEYATYRPDFLKNFLVGFGLVFTGFLTVNLITTFYALLEMAGQTVVDATKLGASNDVA